MRFLFETAVLPYLREERGVRDVILVRTLHVAGWGESIIGEKIADLMERSNPTIGISAKQARYELRIGARAQSSEEAEAMLVATETTLRERLGDILLAEEKLDEQIGRLMAEHNLTLALYEGHTMAPIYHALGAGNVPLPYLRGMMIHPLDTPTGEEAASALAHSGAVTVQNRWRSSLGMAMQAVDRPEARNSAPVCLSLVYPGGSRRQTCHYDLRQREGWDIVATLALNMLRDYLLNLAKSPL
jgi:hypothetical protein